MVCTRAVATRIAEKSTSAAALSASLAPCAPFVPFVHCHRLIRINKSVNESESMFICRHREAAAGRDLLLDASVGCRSFHASCCDRVSARASDRTCEEIESKCRVIAEHRAIVKHRLRSNHQTFKQRECIVGVCVGLHCVPAAIEWTRNHRIIDPSVPQCQTRRGEKKNLLL